MKLLYFEMRKSWLRLPIFITLAVLSALGVFKLYGECRSENPRRTGEGKAWYWSAYTQYNGELSEVKIAEFRALSDTLAAKYNDGNYDREYNAEYITGYLAGDNILLNVDIKREIAYAVTYPNISDGIAAKAYENAVLYDKIGMSYETARNRLICQVYQNRGIPEYRTTFWAEIFFKYDFSSLLCVIMLAAGLSACYTNEKESGMETLIGAAGKRTKTGVAKLCSALVYCAFLSIYFAFFDLLSLNILVGVDGLDMPIYSVKTLQNSPFGFSILSAVFLLVLTRFMALFAVSLLILLISKIAPNTVISLVTGLALPLFLMIFSSSGKAFFDPFCALAPDAYITEFHALDLFGHPILTLYAALAMITIESVILALLIVLFDKFSKVVRTCFERK